MKKQHREERFQRGSRSSTWYLLPIFLTFIGGLIAFFVLRQSDPNKARNCLIIGFVIFTIAFIAGSPMFGGFDMLR